MRKLTTTFLILTLAGSLAACGPQDDEVLADDTGEASSTPAACEQAQAHLQSCFPEQDARVPDDCTEGSAEEILGQSCEQLAAESDAQGKADGFCNPWFWWTCGGGGGFEDEPEGYSFSLGISVCQTTLCTEILFGTVDTGAECGKITLEDASGEVVATDYINESLGGGGIQDTGQGFQDLDLPAGEYTARLWRRDGELARTIEEEPAVIEVTLHEDGDVDHSPHRFEILRSEADQIRACSDISTTMNSTCEQEPMSNEDTEWGWIARLEGANTEGTYLDMGRCFRFYQQDSHACSFRRVRPGVYTITYIEMDVPSWSREPRNASDFEAYEELVEDYATGRELTQDIMITSDDIESEELSFGHVDLEHMECR